MYYNFQKTAFLLLVVLLKRTVSPYKPTGLLKYTGYLYNI